MGVNRYKKKGKTVWRIDTWLDLPNGTRKRWRQGDIPTKEMALAIERKAKTEALESKFLSRISTITVKQAWDNYEPICKRDNKSWQTDAGRAAHFVEHLGDRKAHTLTLQDIDGYRRKRSEEKNRYGKTPAVSSVNREVSLLRRVLNHAVEYGELDRNPLVGVKMLDEDNVRDVTVSEADFQRLLDKADKHLRPVLITAYDTGLREEVILGLKWKYVDLMSGCIRLPARSNRTKKKPPSIPLTSRVLAVMKSLPRSISGYVFVNPHTGTRWVDLKKSWDAARSKAGLPHVWFHDLRRSFVTNARRRGVPESVVMRMSGHKTRSVFDRYNIISEDDLRNAVDQIEVGRKRELAKAKKESRREADGERAEAV